MDKNDDIIKKVSCEKIPNEILNKAKRSSCFNPTPNINNNNNILNDDEFVFRPIACRKISTKITHPLQTKLNCIKLAKKFSILNRTEFNENNDNILLNQRKSLISHEVGELKSKSNTKQYHKKMKRVSIMMKEIKKKIVLEKNVYFDLEPNKNTREYMEDYINIEDMYKNEKRIKFLYYVMVIAVIKRRRLLQRIFRISFQNVLKKRNQSVNQ